MILAAAPTPEYRKFWALMAFAGLRYFEARDLKWKDIDDGKITLVGKGGKLATVPVSERLLAELGAPGDAEATIIAQGTFANNTTSIRALKAAVAKVGLNPEGANNHKFRHSFASNALRAGIGIDVVRRLLRHSNIATTMNIYAHLLDEDLVTDIEKMFRNP